MAGHSDLLEKHAMDAIVIRQLGVECRREQWALPDKHRFAIHQRKYIDVVTGALDEWSANEHAVEGRVETGDVEVGLEAVDLAAEGVAAHVDVEHAEPHLIGPAVLHPFGQQDQTGARPEHRHAIVDPFPDRLLETGGDEQERHRGRLAAWEYQRIDLRKIFGTADLPRLNSKGAQYPPMCDEGALKRQYADFHLEASNASSFECRANAVPLISSRGPCGAILKGDNE
jgi:hypothetical protein